MVIQVIPKRTTIVTLLTLAAVFLTIFCSAQIATQNLFRRTQFIEYLRLRNQSGIQTSRVDPSQTIYSSHNLPGQIVEFNIKCKTTPELYDIWLKGEMHFAFSRWNEASQIFKGLIK